MVSMWNTRQQKWFRLRNLLNSYNRLYFNDITKPDFIELTLYYSIKEDFACLLKCFARS